MASFVYRFTGEVGEDFPYLPADPASRHMEPGDTVECSEEVSHARLELVDGKSPKSAPKPEPAAEESTPSPTAEDSASPAEEA